MNPSFVHLSNQGLSQYEQSWQSKFLKIPVAIHGIVQLLLTVLIIILEIASLATSSYLATGAGIWCSISFMAAAILTNMLGKCLHRKKENSRNMVSLSMEMGSIKSLGYTRFHCPNRSDCFQFYSDWYCWQFCFCRCLSDFFILFIY